MKILYHHRTLGDGAEGIHIREMVAAFRRLGHEVAVVGPVGETTGTSSTSGSILGKIKSVLPRAVFEICEISYSAYIGVILASKMLISRPDFVYDRYITFNFGSVLASKLVGVPLYLEVNAPLALERSIEPDEKLIFRKPAFAIERWACSNANSTIVVSTPLKDYLVAQGVPERKCVVMPNGVDPIKFSPGEKDRALLKSVGATAEDIVIGFTGILRPWHGLDLLVNAFKKIGKKHKNVFLLIVGDGPIRGDLESMIAEAGLQERHCITGRVRHADVPNYVNLLDIAVSPKATFYASPMKVIEYMALGKAVVVPNSQNFLDIIDPLENGITFEVDNGGSLAASLLRLLDDETLRKGLGANARKKTEKRLNWEYNAKSVCSFS